MTEMTNPKPPADQGDVLLKILRHSGKVFADEAASKIEELQAKLDEANKKIAELQLQIEDERLESMATASRVDPL